MTFRNPLHRKRKKGDTAQLAAQLAPLEEQNAHAARQQNANGHGAGQNGLIQEHGALILNTDHLNVLKGIGEQSDAGQGHFLGIEPVVLVIIGLMLAFIAFVAWQISLMPYVD